MQDAVRLIESAAIEDYAAIITADADAEALSRGESFANEISENLITDFKKSSDQMVHVSTFAILDDTVYMTYYANPAGDKEEPQNQIARLTFCRLDDPGNKTYIDLQTAGEEFRDKKVDCVYDTILMHKGDGVLYLLWTAELSGDYYRLYRTYNVKTGELSDIEINTLTVQDQKIDFCFSGIQKVFTETGIGVKKMFADIGIMQKMSTRVEDGKTFYYSGAYSGDHSFVMKSEDFINWHYVSMPDFINHSKWENAVYVTDDYCYYFVRQQDDSPYGFLTRYCFETNSWDKPVLVEDSQSRSDFIMYNNELYLFHAPKNREHIGILHVDRDNISKSRVVVQAEMKESCFYPFVEYGPDGIYFSYTVSRKNIKLSKFDPKKYLIL